MLTLLQSGNLVPVDGSPAEIPEGRGYVLPNGGFVSPAMAGAVPGAAAAATEVAARDARAQLHAGCHGHQLRTEHVGDLAGRPDPLRLVH